jgi:hypothetical protein
MLLLLLIRRTCGACRAQRIRPRGDVVVGKAGVHRPIAAWGVDVLKRKDKPVNDLILTMFAWKVHKLIFASFQLFPITVFEVDKT